MGNWQEMRLVTSINPFLLKLLIRKFQKINQFYYIKMKQWLHVAL